MRKERWRVNSLMLGSGRIGALPSNDVECLPDSDEWGTTPEALRQALARIDATRSERVDAQCSLDLWLSLTAGGWSVVEHFERDGRVYCLLHEDDRESRQAARLTQREHE